MAGDEPWWIDESDALARLVERVAGEPCLAIDTESNSMHAYFERVCLVQVSVPGVDALVDPLTLDLGPLLALLADPGQQKTLHGADYDILCLKRQYGCELANLFDTVIAARVLGWESVGLAAIIESRFAVKLDKKYQRYDWARRPIDAAARSYARLDTHFLLELREQQLAELRERGRVEIFEHACTRQTRVQPKPRSFDPSGYRRISGSRDLDQQGEAALAALWTFREDDARRRDRPPFRVMGDTTLLELARRRPTSRAELVDVPGLPRPILQRGAGRLLACIADAPPAAPARRERVDRPSKTVLERYERLRAWRTRYAKEIDLQPDLILPKSVLLAVAAACPADLDELGGVPEIDAWERERYGVALVEVLNSAPGG